MLVAYLRNIIIVSVLCFLWIPLYAQGEEILTSDMPIRSFKLENDTLYYSHNDFLKVVVKEKNILDIYLGGYILDFNVSNNIITGLSNKYKADLGTIRRYDYSGLKYNLVYNINKKSPMLSYDYYPKENDSLSIVVSFMDGSLISYNSRGEEIRVFKNKGSKVRQVSNFNGTLYYCTDDGELFKIVDDISDKLYSSEARILGFIIKGTYICMYREDGSVVFYNLKTSNHDVIHPSNSIIMDICLINDEEMIVADWAGYVYIIDMSKKDVKRKIKAHKDIIYKIQRINDSIFATSSRDMKIKKWNIKRL